MAKGKSPNKASVRYGQAGTRKKNKLRNVEREIKAAEARIRHIKSRVTRGVISEDASKAPIARQEKHILNLRERIKSGFDNRPGWTPGATKAAPTKEKKSKKDE